MVDKTQEVQVLKKSKSSKKFDIDCTHEKLKKSLEIYIAEQKENGNDEVVYTAHTFLEWLDKKTDIIKTEKQFIMTSEMRKSIKRSKVVWIDFGFNIADEFGGKHPAIIYRVSGTQVFVFPLTTQPPNSRNKDLFVKIPYVKNFYRMDRWINVLNLKCVSVQRIDFNSNVGEVTGKVLNDIGSKWQEKGIR